MRVVPWPGLEIPLVAAGAGDRDIDPGWRGTRAAIVPGMRRVRTRGAGGAGMSRTAEYTASDAVRQRGALARELIAQGFRAEIKSVDGYECVHVVSQTVPELAEDVRAFPDSDGVWWFWWSWDDRIAGIGEVETAAFKVAYVLTPDAHG